MTSQLLILLALIFAGFLILGVLIRKWMTDLHTNKPDELIGELLRSFDVRSQEQSKVLREQTRILNERLDNAARAISQVQKNIGEFSEIGRGIKQLQEFLQSPKLRGNIGEEVLTDLISQMFPKSSFVLQHSFKSGVRVDAAIKTDAGYLPIDAKFPLENYQKMVKSETEVEKKSFEKEFARDLKNHIDTISEKYILPEEGTVDFALMYVPAESVFYEMAHMTEVMTYARKKRVYPVSPTTLYAHLQTILLSFAGKQLETKTRSVFKMLRAMLIDYEKIDGSLGVLGKHLTNAMSQMNQVTHSFQTFGHKLRSSQTLQEDEKESLSD